MSNQRKIQQASQRRAASVRHKLRLVSNLPRVSVFRSLNHMYAQLIDDAKGNTISSCSSQEFKNKGDKKTIAKTVGLELAKRAKAKGVDTACFDRGEYRYHGRVKELCEGLREGGLKI